MAKVRLRWEGEGEEVPFYAMCHFNKKLMFIISSCGMTLPRPSKTRHRYFYKKNAIVHRNWLLKQLRMMAVYHGNYNAIDQLNKEAFGHVSNCKAIGI